MHNRKSNKITPLESQETSNNNSTKRKAENERSQEHTKKARISTKNQPTKNQLAKIKVKKGSGEPVPEGYEGETDFISKRIAKQRRMNQSIVRVEKGTGNIVTDDYEGEIELITVGQARQKKLNQSLVLVKAGTGVLVPASYLGKVDIISQAQAIRKRCNQTPVTVIAGTGILIPAGYSGESQIITANAARRRRERDKGNQSTDNQVVTENIENQVFSNAVTQNPTFSPSKAQQGQRLDNSAIVAIPAILLTENDFEETKDDAFLDEVKDAANYLLELSHAPIQQVYADTQLQESDSEESWDAFMDEIRRKDAVNSSSEKTQLQQAYFAAPLQQPLLAGRNQNQSSMVTSSAFAPQTDSASSHYQNKNIRIHHVMANSSMMQHPRVTPYSFHPIVQRNQPFTATPISQAPVLSLQNQGMPMQFETATETATQTQPARHPFMRESEANIYSQAGQRQTFFNNPSRMIRNNSSQPSNLALRKGI